MQTLPPELYEIILVDVGLNTTDNNKYVDRLLKQFSHLPIHYIPAQGVKRAEAKNKGLNASSGKTLFLTDGDVMIPPDFLERLVKCGLEKTVVVGNCIDGPSFLSFSRREVRTGQWVKRFAHSIDRTRIGIFCLDRWDAIDQPILSRIRKEYEVSIYGGETLAGTLYRDLRKGHDLVGGLKQPMPWSLAYGRAVWIQKQYVGRWDERLIGWPGDDVDIASHWAMLGLNFLYAIDLFALHLDHCHPRLSHVEASPEIIRANERIMKENAILRQRNIKSNTIPNN